MDFKGYRVGVVVAKWNREITEKLEEGALRRLKEKGLEPQQVHLSYVAGAFEIPLAAQAYMDKNFDAVITLGCVIRGETTHYDLICNSVERACTNLQLMSKRPVVFGVLTTENEAQAFDRVGGAFGHKGEECADVALEMLEVLKTIRAL